MFAYSIRSTFLKECLPIHDDITPNAEFLSIFCKDVLEFLTFVDVLHYTPLKPKVEERLAKISLETPNSSSPATPHVNVVMFGLDAVSHLNFQRTMPQTREYILQEMGAGYMGGYTKVADNTFPNLVPVLTGMDIPELTAACWPVKESHFDACPFIWKDFSSIGYRTSYAEDAIGIGIFTHEKKGFEEPPTDYFLNDFMKMAENNYGHWKTDISQLCYGPRLAFSMLLDNVKYMAHQMGRDRPYFQFTWATSISHDYLNYPQKVDAEMREGLKFLHESAQLNNTVLIIMSDHGSRYGKIRETFQGKMEENMPFLYVVFPTWFKSSYPSAIRNFYQNQQKLTTHFDLHEMLKDLLDLSSLTETEIQRRQRELSATSRGISLFLSIPSTRTCEDAAIPHEYCVCHSMTPVAVSSNDVEDVVSAAVQKLNTLLARHVQCSQLEKGEITSAYNVGLLQPYAAGLSDKPLEYAVTFKTIPGKALFEATVMSTSSLGNGSRIWNILGDISRVNAYGNQSHCVDDYTLKKYCYCQM